ncbi:mechanosensitive ion channel family protein [Ectobacillus sp. sgz5001026]|uniref:mechanosensitive ion channel family protein n=1 Tax=Ectobacillus sp. sgz5001026 TaxID=3242473 RepID=UPI0036D2BFBA
MSWFETTYNQLVSFLLDTKIWINFSIGVVKIIFILLAANITVRVGKAIIRNAFKINAKSPLSMSKRRTTTVARLLQNIITYVVYFVVIIMILGILGIETRGILAGAGVIGLAIGFGAQNLVRDVITGFFILLEDQFSVGDYVKLGRFEGVVQEIGLRTTKIKSWTGELHILPNGGIKEVTNYSLSNSVAFVDVSISYDSNIHHVERVLESLLDELPMRYEQMVKRPELLGIQNLGASDVVMRIVAEVHPMQHFVVGRALRKEIKLRLDEEGIEIPYPHMILYNRQEAESQKAN